jgi:hypothetical protein
MPLTSTVTVLTRTGTGTVGEYLRAVAAAGREPADLVVVPVGDGGQLDKDEELDAVLGVQAVEVVAAYQLNGRAGQIACVVAKTAGTAVRIAFLGVGDRSAGALRRAAGELGRMLRPGETVVSAAVFGKPPVQPARVLASGCGQIRNSRRPASAVSRPWGQDRTALPRSSNSATSRRARSGMWSWWARATAPGHRPDRRGREHAVGIGVPARRCHHGFRRPDRRGAQH